MAKNLNTNLFVKACEEGNLDAVQKLAPLVDVSINGCRPLS